MSKLFFLVAGEASGDILGSRLIRALKTTYPDAVFLGIGGSLMQAEGFESLFPMERLSVMGIVPILKRLPELLNMRRKLASIISDANPDCFIGIDAPEFNLGLEGKLKSQGIKTIHYVSPSVWAWREKRIFKIARSVSLMLCLFPFELPIYRRHNIPAVCIGHPLANEIPMQPDKQTARSELSLLPEKLVIALLPGSRGSEVKYLLEPFIKTAEMLIKDYPDAQFVLPCANARRRQQIDCYLVKAKLPTSLNNPDTLMLVDGQSRKVMQAADVIMLASGTATLEAMLMKKPMLVAYKVSAFSMWIFKKLLRIGQYSLPNLLAGKPVVKEMIQENCEPRALYREMSELIKTRDNSHQVKEFHQLHASLILGGSEKAANAIAQLLEGKTDVK